MFLPPLPAPIPPGRWLIRAVAGIRRTAHSDGLGHEGAEDNTERGLVLVIAPINDRLSPLATTVWAKGAVDLRRQTVMTIPLTFFPAASAGSILEGEGLWRPQDEEACARIFDLDIDGEEKHTRLVDVPQSLLEWGSYYWQVSANDKRNFRNLGALTVHAGDTTLLIPSFELIRFYLSANSSAFSAALLKESRRDFSNVEDLDLFLDLPRSGLDRQGTFHAALRPGVSRQSAYLLGRLHGSGYALQQLANVVKGFRRTQADAVAPATAMLFPFTGTTSLRVVGKSLQRSDGGSVFLVQRILSCSHPLPFEGVRVHLPYSVLKSADVDVPAPLGPVWVPPTTGGRPRKPRGTQWRRPPEKRPPARFELESVKTMFPDLADKPFDVPSPQPRLHKHRWKSSKGGEEGGFGPGQPGGEGTPVLIEPETSDRNPVTQRAAVDHLEMLRKAVPLLRQAGFTVTSCLASHPSGVIDLADPDPEVKAHDWTYVHDDSLAGLRPRTAWMLRLDRPTQGEDAPSTPLVGYVFELESQVSVLLYFETPDRTEVPKEVLEAVVAECKRLQGAWRQQIDYLDGTTKRRRYVLKADLPDLRVVPEVHRWKTPEELAARLAVLHSASIHIEGDDGHPRESHPHIEQPGEPVDSTPERCLQEASTEADMSFRVRI